MPKQLTAAGVGKRPVVAKLVNLADIVQEGAREQQVAVDLRVIPGNQIAGTEQRHNVIQEPANVSVMKSLRGWRAAICESNFRIKHKRLHQGS